MFSIFQSKKSLELDAFIKSLTDDLIKRYPPELDNKANNFTSVNRLTRILEETCEKAANFQQSKKLGIYGKAKLGNKFKWTLSEAGYRKAFVEMATEAIVIHISKKPKTSK